jgi:hypothetical protein
MKWLDLVASDVYTPSARLNDQLSPLFVHDLTGHAACCPFDGVSFVDHDHMPTGARP